MRILEAQGLIATQAGSGEGSFIAELRALSLLEIYPYFQALSLADFYQMRKAPEPEMAAALAGQLDTE